MQMQSLPSLGMLTAIFIFYLQLTVSPPPPPPIIIILLKPTFICLKSILNERYCSFDKYSIGGTWMKPALLARKPQKNSFHSLVFSSNMQQGTIMPYVVLQQIKCWLILTNLLIKGYRSFTLITIFCSVCETILFLGKFLESRSFSFCRAFIFHT